MCIARPFSHIGPCVLAVGLLLSPNAFATMAGGEFALPADSPSKRLDTENLFPFVGALAVDVSGSSYFGSAVALSPNWVLTAAHNTDFNDDGQVDAAWTGSVQLPGVGSYPVSTAIPHPAFTGFASPSLNDDLALLELAVPLPPSMTYPRLGRSLSRSDLITVVGFGRSGYGSYGYTTGAGLSHRRSGQNVVDSLLGDDEGSGALELFTYDFDDPGSTGQADGSLGNAIETLIGPGDSGGPALMFQDGNWQVVGINTWTEGYGGRFGDTGGGVVLDPYRAWILETTGLAIPEPTSLILVLFGAVVCRLRMRFSKMEQGAVAR